MPGNRASSGATGAGMSLPRLQSKEFSLPAYQISRRAQRACTPVVPEAGLEDPILPDFQSGVCACAAAEWPHVHHGSVCDCSWPPVICKRLRFSLLFALYSFPSTDPIYIE